MIWQQQKSHQARYVFHLSSFLGTLIRRARTPQNRGSGKHSTMGQLLGLYPDLEAAPGRVQAGKEKTKTLLSPCFPLLSQMRKLENTNHRICITGAKQGLVLPYTMKMLHKQQHWSLWSSLVDPIRNYTCTAHSFHSTGEQGIAVPTSRPAYVKPYRTCAP